MKHYPTLLSVQEFQNVVLENKACLLYFSTNSCSVGEALDKKVRILISSDFPEMNFYYVDINNSPELAASQSAFIEPTILVFFEGKESIRFSRNISIHHLQKSIDRLYKLIFDNSL